MKQNIRLSLLDNSIIEKYDEVKNIYCTRNTNVFIIYGNDTNLFETTMEKYDVMDTEKGQYFIFLN